MVLHDLKNTVENMDCGIRKKIRMVHKYILSEYGDINYKIRYSKKTDEYHDNTILFIKLSDKKYAYIDV